MGGRPSNSWFLHSILKLPVCGQFLLSDVLQFATLRSWMSVSWQWSTKSSESIEAGAKRGVTEEYVHFLSGLPTFDREESLVSDSILWGSCGLLEVTSTSAFLYHNHHNYVGNQWTVRRIRNITDQIKASNFQLSIWAINWFNHFHVFLHFFVFSARHLKHVDLGRTMEQHNPNHSGAVPLWKNPLVLHLPFL